MEQQIFEITNVHRHMYGRDQLQWENQARDVAFSHSKDMAENDYFSHNSLDGQGLQERLAVKEISYVTAGENIAAQYPDRSEEHTSELQSRFDLVCRLLLEKK